MPLLDNLSTVEAVTFDAGGTLIEPWPSAGEVYASVAAAQGLGQFEAADLASRFARAWQEKGPFDYSKPAWKRIVERVFEGLLPVPVGEAYFDALYERFGQPDAWHVFDDALPCLELLAGHGFRLAVLSNWDERLRPLLSGLGLDRFFEAIVISGEVGSVKPSPEIFRRAAAQLGQRPAQILHVGDSRAEDFQGAKAAGFQAVLLQRKVAAPEAAIVSSLLDLPGLIFPE